MASLTAGTFLMVGTESSGTITYSKLCDISEYPDLGSTVDSQDVTTLSDACHKYIDALPDPGGSMEFSGFLARAGSRNMVIIRRILLRAITSATPFMTMMAGMAARIKT